MRMSGLDLLFLSTKATRPSYRFRVEQMLPHLEQRGHRCSVGFFPRNPLSRLWFYRNLSRFDAVLVQQRTFSAVELSILRRQASRLVFDVDDAVMFDGRGRSDRRRSRRFAGMIAAADLVICGNPYLRDQALQFESRSRCNVAIEVLPTAIDTDRFRPGLGAKQSPGLVTIGWTGSRSTNRHLNPLLPVLAELAGTAELKVMSETPLGLDFEQLGRLPHRFVKWTALNEVPETAEFDIGLMPLQIDNMTRGKCGCKALQYMALGIPAVCSPVGMNCDLIQHGRNGFLPVTSADWIETLRTLIRDVGLRQRIGRAGRETVLRGYSVREVSTRLAELLEAVVRPQRLPDDSFCGPSKAA